MGRKAKARLQAGGRYTGTFDVLFRTVRTEGFSTLYRGFGAILVGGKFMLTKLGALNQHCVFL